MNDLLSDAYKPSATLLMAVVLLVDNYGKTPTMSFTAPVMLVAKHTLPPSLPSNNTSWQSNTPQQLWQHY
jgi:hypothetical protein